MNDLIYKHEAIDAVVNKCTDIYVGNLPVMVDKKEVYSVLQGLPSVTPKRKTGKWVNNIHDLPVCDQCGYMTPYDRAIDDYEYGNYCPNCGAKMEEVNNE